MEEITTANKSVQGDHPHRPSIASTASLEPFSAEEPQKVSKRVSFTDDQVDSHKSDEETEKEHHSKSSSNERISKGQEGNISTSLNPLTVRLRETKRHLEHLHQPSGNEDLRSKQANNNHYSTFFDEHLSQQRSLDANARASDIVSKIPDSKSMENSQLEGHSVKSLPESAMECEAKCDKLRWLLISECSAFLGSGKHTREAFHKKFLHKVSEVS